MAEQDYDLITVCASCLTASCWQGLFPCARHVEAEVRRLGRAELRALGLEHESYWKTDDELDETRTGGGDG